VGDFIRSILPDNVDVKYNLRRILQIRKELDIYIPSKKLAIEYHGLHWHGESVGTDKNYHLNKYNECKAEGIRLIQIFEDEWLSKAPIVMRRLQHILGLDTERVYARQCIIKSVPFQEACKFLESYHLQGKDRSSIRYGAYYNDKLVALMTFGKLRKALGHKNVGINDYEIYRFCVGNASVVGIASKLFKHFIENHHPQKVLSYADIRWSHDDAFYSKLGFKLDGYTSPNYWYFFGNDCTRHHRFAFRKDQLSKLLSTYNADLTEWQNMQANGFDRIWDCGNMRYIWLPS
jgi:hypothetical protein